MLSKINSQIISKSIRSTSNTFIIILGILMLSGFSFLVEINFLPKNEYEQNFKKIVFLCLIVLILYLLFYYANQKKIYVYQNHFEIKNLLRTRKYYFTEIKTSYSEFFKGKYNSWTEYYIITKTNEKITLIDTEYSNFHDFFSEIKSKIKKDKALNLELSKPKFLQYSIICGIISLLLFGLSSYFYDFKKITNNDFHFLSGILKEDIAFVKNGKRSQYFELRIVDFPLYQFKISQKKFNNFTNRHEILKKFKAGTKIKIGIDKEDYNKKILKTDNLSIIDKYFHFSTIRVEQLVDANNLNYINLEEANRLKTESNYMVIGFCSLFGMFFLYLTFGNYQAYLKSKL